MKKKIRVRHAVFLQNFLVPAAPTKDQLELGSILQGKLVRQIVLEHANSVIDRSLTIDFQLLGQSLQVDVVAQRVQHGKLTPQGAGLACIEHLPYLMNPRVQLVDHWLKLGPLAIDWLGLGQGHRFKSTIQSPMNLAPCALRMFASSRS